MIVNTLSKISIFSLSVFLMASCASTDVADLGDINQKKIYQDYSIDIDQSTGKMEAEAQFRFGGSGGTTLRLSGEAGITINSKEMDGDELFLRGLVYQERISDDKDYTFVFTDANGDTYTNSIGLESIDLNSVPPSISGKEKMTVSWEGAPLGANETVTLYASDSHGSFGTEIGQAGGKGATSVETNPLHVKQLLNGSGEIYIMRTVDKPLDQEADEGGSLRADYRSESYSIEIVDAKIESQGGGGNNVDLDEAIHDIEEELKEELN